MKIISNTTNKDLPWRYGLYQRPSSEENGTNSSSGYCHGSDDISLFPVFIRSVYGDGFLASSHLTVSIRQIVFVSFVDKRLYTNYWFSRQ